VAWRGAVQYKLSNEHISRRVPGLGVPSIKVVQDPTPPKPY
jgi:hypothetical protein